jgi:hypothetical protein
VPLGGCASSIGRDPASVFQTTGHPSTASSVSRLILHASSAWIASALRLTVCGEPYGTGE